MRTPLKGSCCLFSCSCLLPTTITMLLSFTKGSPQWSQSRPILIAPCASTELKSTSSHLYGTPGWSALMYLSLPSDRYFKRLFTSHTWGCTQHNTNNRSRYHGSFQGTNLIGPTDCLREFAIQKVKGGDIGISTVSSAGALVKFPTKLSVGWLSLIFHFSLLGGKGGKV